MRRTKLQKTPLKNSKTGTPGLSSTSPLGHQRNENRSNKTEIKKSRRIISLVNPITAARKRNEGSLIKGEAIEGTGLVRTLVEASSIEMRWAEPKLGGYLVEMQKRELRGSR